MLQSWSMGGHVDDHRGSFQQNCRRNRPISHWSRPSSGISEQIAPKTDTESDPALWSLAAPFLFWPKLQLQLSEFHRGSNHLLAPRRSEESEKHTASKMRNLRFENRKEEYARLTGS